MPHHHRAADAEQRRAAVLGIVDPRAEMPERLSASRARASPMAANSSASMDSTIPTMPSLTLITTLPVNPSQTTTSAAPE